LSSVFSGLITSKTRVRILMGLFLNPDRRAYLRELASEFASSPSQIKGELENLTEAGLLASERQGRQLYFRANPGHPLFPELHSMVRKALGMDRIVESIVGRLGDLEAAYVIDDYAEGRDTGIIDLVLVGRPDERNLTDLVRKTERYIERKIRTLVLTREEHEGMKTRLATRPQLPLWIGRPEPSEP